jgi:hypothetical protein
MMNLNEKMRKFAVNTGGVLGVFGGFLVFLASYNGLRDSSHRLFLSLLAGLSCFCMVCGAIIGVHKLIRWVIVGFYRDEEEASAQRMNLKRGSRRFAFLLAGLAGLCGGLFGGSIPYGQYRIALEGLRTFEIQQKEYEGTAYYDYMQRERLEDNYWLKLPKGQLVGLCIIGGLWGAALGSCLVLVGHKFIEQMFTGPCDSGGRGGKNDMKLYSKRSKSRWKH